MNKLSKEQETEIIESIKKTVAKPMQRHIALIGAATALQTAGFEIPVFWHINIMCGRTDRIFKSK